MKILSAEQMRMADSHTIKNEPVSSSDLMERAGKMCFEWLIKNTDYTKKHVIICGTGNNGGDGLVIARLFSERKNPVELIILSSSAEPSPDFKKKFSEINTTRIKTQFLKEGELFSLEKDVIIVDAVFGTGLSRPVNGWLGHCIGIINNSENEIISIDLPSGLFADSHSEGKIICANHTLTFQCPKLAFFFPENEKFTGEFHVIDIDLDKDFINKINVSNKYLNGKSAKKHLVPRSKFSHKGNYGHSLLVSGSIGKIGAAVLGARACLRSGTGLLTVHVPRCGYEILQTTVPEAMVECDIKDENISGLKNIETYNAIGIGPGIGKSEETKKMFFDLLDNFRKPIVVDADALNILSEKPDELKKLPHHSILTPHIKEFERLAGKSSNDFERHKLQVKFSIQYNIIVILKGAHTCITLPDGRSYFNSTGNPGMAKGGSGDALTGMILAFLSQNYKPEAAAILGVYIHGLAGDIAADKKGIYSMITSDIIENIPKAFLKVSA